MTSVLQDFEEADNICYNDKKSLTNKNRESAIDIRVYPEHFYQFWRVIGGISYYRYCGKNDQRYAISYPVPTGSLPIDSKHHALL